ncbi:LOW QUALITY PROTEIN: hypothetical protein MXB_1611 [Myxobolus squamalis]|nr:LOW QUALITY PROTEIN: hypothetical protein MXB_1611 [Myxobolus squamalis]
MRRKLSDEGLLHQYNNTPDFALSARMIVSLAFVRPQDIDMALNALSDDLLRELLPFKNDTYVGSPNHNQTRGRALFPIQIWSVYQTTLDDEDRTNNHVEASHRQMKEEFGMTHPSFWRFIDGLRKIQKGRDQYFEEYI